MEPGAFASIVRQKTGALERKRDQLLTDLDAQLGLLELAHAEACKTGASQTALNLEAEIQRLKIVRVDAFQRLNEAISELNQSKSDHRNNILTSANPNMATA